MRIAQRLGLVVLVLALTASVAGAAVPRSAVADTTSDSLLFIRDVIVGTIPCPGCEPRVCVEKPVPVTVRGAFPNACYSFRGLRELPVASPFPVLQADIVQEDCSGGCPDVATPFAGSAELPAPLSPGTHSFLLIEQVRGCPDSMAVISTRSRMISYVVTYPCVPSDSVARSLVNFSVSPPHPCAGDSVSLVMAKNGCPPCVDLTSLDPGHATLDWQPNCFEFACFPETLTTPLGVFAPGHFVVNTQVDVHVLGTPAPDSTITFVAQTEFDVPLACDTTAAPCLSPFLRAGGLRTPEACALTVDPGQAGTMLLSFIPPVPLGGFEGRIDCSPPFRIVRAGAVPGMDQAHVFSTPEGRGIRYLVITDLRQPFPAVPGPAMQLEIAADAGALPGSHGVLFPVITLASDVNGDSVALCDVRAVRPLPIQLCVTGDDANCDANGDGRGDVRDLVLMSRCFRHVLSPPDSARICRDCNGDSTFTFADLLCCARHILRGPPLPRDSVQADERLSVRFDPPIATANGGLLVTARVGGVRSLSAAVLHLKYPAGRWQASMLPSPIVGATGPIGAEGWLPIVDIDEPGVVHLGAVRITEDAADEVLFKLVFTPIAPQAGDRIEVEGADLGSPDGGVLTPNGVLPTLTLDTPPGPPSAKLQLSAARPNPFGTSTTFFVRLPTSALVDLAVHDLAGRRIATITHGTYEAGDHPFTWDGADAHDGVYFVRLAVDGQVLSTRVAMLRGSR